MKIIPVGVEDDDDEKCRRKFLGLSVLRRLAGCEPSTSVVGSVVVDVDGVAVGVGGVISKVGAESFGIRKNFPESSSVTSASGSRINRFTIWKNRIFII